VVWRLLLKDTNIKFNFYEGFDWHRTRLSFAEKFRCKEPADDEVQSASAEISEPAIEIAWDDESLLGYTEREEERDLDQYSTTGPSIDDDSMLGDAPVMSTIAPSSVPRAPIEPLDLPSIDEVSDEVRSVIRGLKPSMDVVVTRLNVVYDIFDNSSGKEEYASRLVVSIHDLEITDHLKRSAWRKFLTYLKPAFDEPEYTRESTSQMFRLELGKVRPFGRDSQVEHRLKVRNNSKILCFIFIILLIY
jgi:hypothetical protein